MCPSCCHFVCCEVEVEFRQARGFWPEILERTAEYGLLLAGAMSRSYALSYVIAFVYDDVEFSGGRP